MTRYSMPIASAAPMVEAGERVGDGIGLTSMSHPIATKPLDELDREMLGYLRSAYGARPAYIADLLESDLPGMLANRRRVVVARLRNLEALGLCMPWGTTYGGAVTRWKITPEGRKVFEASQRGEHA